MLLSRSSGIQATLDCFGFSLFKGVPQALLAQVEAFMFGSVPLKTYLPDGDIDLSVFQSKGSSLRDTWTTKLSSVLEDEQRDPYAAFKVRDVQVIHAEVQV